MPKIYKNQSFLSIKLITGVNISGASLMKIKYRKPSGTSGDWPATMVSSSGVIKYDIASAYVLDEIGTWTVWAYITFSNGKSAPGEPTKFQVYEEGS